MKWIDKLFEYMLASEVPRDIAVKARLRQMKALLHWDGRQYERCGAWARSYDNLYIVELDPSQIAGGVKSVTWALLHELGHIAHGHVKLNSSSLGETYARQQRNARKADELAAVSGITKGQVLAFVNGQTEEREEAEASQFADEKINQWLPIAQYLQAQENK